MRVKVYWVVLVVVGLVVAFLFTHSTTNQPMGKALLQVTGSGSRTTKVTVTKEWDLVWSYDCKAAAPDDVYFVVFPDLGLDSVIKSNPRGSGVEHYHSGGSINLYIDSGSACSWTVKVYPA